MIIIDTYRTTYQIPSNVTFSVRLGSYNNFTQLRWQFGDGDYMAFDINNYQNNPSYLTCKTEFVEELKEFSKLIFEKLESINKGLSYNLNDAIHALFIDKSFFRDRKIGLLL